MEDNILTKLKEAVIAIREFLIIGLFMWFLIQPAGIKDRLVAAGFTKVDFGFAEWEAALVESQQNLQDAEQKTVETQHQLEQVSTELEKWTSNTEYAVPPELSVQARTLKMNVDNTNEELRRVDSDLNNSIQQHQILIDDIKAKKARKSQ
ncbi:MAG: hypothetical protein ACR2MM_07840 [Flavobacteriaceae bacterium]